MVRDLEHGAPADLQHADVCIVGAGAAGILLATELARHGKSVLLLEGGGRDVEEPSQEPYQGETTGVKHTGIHIGRFRATGGSTNRWGGQILELDDLDFQKRDAVAGSGWPIAKSDLTPHYARAIELEGLAGSTLRDEAVWKEIGLSTPHLNDLQPFFSRWCPEPNFARLHRDTLESKPAVTVWLHANAVDITWESTRFRGVRCRTLSGITATFTADEFVFCLGGIESSRFFLQPRAAVGPWLHSGLLGRHFQDHIICAGAVIEPAYQRGLHNTFDNVFSRGYKYQPKLRLAPAQQAAAGTLNVAATVSFLGDSDQILAQLKETAKRLLRGRWRESKPSEVLYALRHAPLLARQAYRYSVEHRAFNPPGGTIELLVHCEQEPESKSTITLAESRDSLGLQRTRLNWQVSEHELRSIRTITEVAAKSLAHLGRVVPDPDLMALDLRFIERCGDGYHHMGGMRMSTSAATGLVDTDLRLHGTENAYICSSAVFPTSGFSNPTHTLLALAVRLAAHLS